jgi:hypothetical protein
MGNQLRAAIALLLMAGVLILPSFVYGPSAADSGPYNYAWTRQFAEAFARGELYPRWMPDSFRGLGSPTFFFYPPLAFYVSGLIDLAGASTWQAINIAAVAFLWASGLTMWLWLRDKSGRPLLWACLYMVAPYHLADFYIRAALAEFAAYAWLPLIVMGFENRPRLLAVAFAGLVCTHLPMAVLCGVFLIGPLIVAKLARREPIGADLAAGVVALILSAIYLLPALTLQRYVSMAALWSADFRPGGMSVWFSNMPRVHVAAAGGVAVLAASLAWTARGSALPRFWALLALATALLAAGVVPWIWALPVLEKVQFPYRLLTVAEFAAVAGLALHTPTASLIRSPLRVGVFACAFALTYNLGIAGKMLRADATTRRAYIERELPDAPEYMPPGAAPSGLSMRSRYPDVERFLPADRFNFPIWQVIVDGRGVTPSGPTIPVGSKVVRRALPVETIGSALSGLGLIALLAWAFVDRRRTSRP